MIPKAFLILALDALAVGAVQGKGWNGAGGFLSGTLLGLLCGARAASRCGRCSPSSSAAWRAEWRCSARGPPSRSRPSGSDAAGCVGGFGAVYLIAMGVEVWMLASLGERLE
jgi:hypothetical protein